MRKEQLSPFKFLDAYTKADKDIFFGREAEVEQLYKMTYQTNLLLIYGMSGTGKTSIVQGGLATRFDTSDWFDILIRKEEDINFSLERQLIKHDSLQSFEDDYDIDEMVKSLYLDFLRPIYLIFDQFEELYILGTKEEQNTFIKTVKHLLNTPDLPCKILIVIREEYLAHLSGFEKVVSTLFDKRLRIEPMTRQNAKEVIIKTAANPRFNIQLGNDNIAEQIIEKVTEGKGRIHLPYLQVMLDRLYRSSECLDDGTVLFNEESLAKVGQIKDVLGDFLEEQIMVFDRDVDSKEDAIRFLKAFVSDQGTKVPIKREDITNRLSDFSPARIAVHLQFFVKNRIIRPLDNEQYELSHDSLAAKISQTRLAMTPMPKIDKSDQLPSNPFVGFKSYPKNLAQVFFGRDEEIADLFDKIVNDLEVRTTLLIGPIGVGKTSLIKAGLIPRLEKLMDVKYIKCSRELIDSAELLQMMTKEPDYNKPPAWLELAYKWDKHLPDEQIRKVIILDQFEEIFVWISQQEHLTHLFLHLGYLLESRQNVDLVISLRDEYFSYLQELEAFLPKLLEEQIRLRYVTFRQAEKIIKKSVDYADLQFEDHQVIKQILKNIQQEDGKINLTYLQVYMKKLFEELLSE